MDQIKDLFGQVIKNSSLDPTRLRLARLQEDWPEIAGESLARHIKVDSLRNGELKLRASDPSWSHEASMLRENLRKEINEYFDTELVTSIRILS